MDTGAPPARARTIDPDQLILRWTRKAHDHAVVVLDTAGVIVGWLGAAELLLGYAPQDAVGRHIALIFTEEDRADGYPAYELKVAADDRYSEDSRWHVRQDGTRVWISGTMSPVRDEAGELLGFIKFMRDLTDQRTQIERFENKLAELDTARSETHRFLRTLGHEIRNPLAVLGNLEAILNRLATDDRAKKLSQQLSAQLAVLKKLADDLMDVSRLELGKLDLDLQRCDLRELLEAGAASMQEAAQRKSIMLETLLPSGALLVRADRARIQQVVLNLLGNAIKYTHERGSVWVKASLEGNEVVCRVQDTGIGIFPPMLPKIFNLFSQAPEAEEMREGGIGVGLALVRQIVELHGGTVQARSPGIGKGSEFLFRLPAEEPSDVEPREPR